MTYNIFIWEDENVKEMKILKERVVILILHELDELDQVFMEKSCPGNEVKPSSRVSLRASSSIWASLARARGWKLLLSSAPCSRVLARLTSLAQIGELAGRLSRVNWEKKLTHSHALIVSHWLSWLVRPAKVFIRRKGSPAIFSLSCFSCKGFPKFCTEM